MRTYVEAMGYNHPDNRSNDLYDQAKNMLNHTFLIVRPDADVVDELLGEVVEAQDMFYNPGCEEPMFIITGVDYAVPMSALTLA